jgi:cytochrome c oxidase cbb3-type subunit 1
LSTPIRDGNARGRGSPDDGDSGRYTPVAARPAAAPGSGGAAVAEYPIDADAETLALERSRIDRSCATPVLTLYSAALLWLAIGTLAAMVSSIKLHSPEFLGGAGWLGFGRVRPIHLNAVAYGFGGQAALGTMIWLMCRLGRTPLKRQPLLMSAGVLWNIGMIVGSVAVLAGYSTGVEWLEFPTYAAFFLFAAFALVGLWAIMQFSERREKHVYVSQWYIFGGLFWFPWLYTTVQLLLLMAPVKGVTQAMINWWYGHNALGLFFTPMAVATAYYLIPKVIGRPIYSYHLSILGFWSLALFYSWAGAHHLVGGPIPAWLITASAVGSMMMFIPVTMTAINHHMTMKGHFGLLRYSPTLRFVVFGAVCYTLASFQGSLMALRIYNEPFHFTHHTVGHAHLGLYAFFTMIMFGAFYYIVPRLTGREWASAALIKTHFWSCAAGITLMVVALSVGGMIQGWEMNQASEPLGRLIGEHGLFAGTWRFFAGFKAKNGAVGFMDIVRDSIPWLWARSASGILLTLGHATFIVLFAMNLLGVGPVHGRSGPTLLADDSARYRRLLGLPEELPGTGTGAGSAAAAGTGAAGAAGREVLS